VLFGIKNNLKNLFKI